MSQKPTPAEIQQALAQHTGSDTAYRHLLLSVRYTAGIKHMAEICQAHWLVDAIASWQPQCKQDAMLKEMQFWTLRKEGDAWILICDRDTDDEAFRQEIGYSDFPLEQIEIWVCDDMLLLPSEY